MRVFISYARFNEPIVVELDKLIRQLGHKVWFDHQLIGGPNWWDQILDEIRQCDIFVFLLSLHSLESQACRLELGWASALNRHILPIQVGDVNFGTLPESLAVKQVVDFRNLLDKTEILTRALSTFTPRQLPESLQRPPLPPLHRLNQVATLVSQLNPLDEPTQRAVLDELREALGQTENAESAYQLLKRLSQRSDIIDLLYDQVQDLINNPPRIYGPQRLTLARYLSLVEQRLEIMGYKPNPFPLSQNPLGIDARYLKIEPGEDWTTALGQYFHIFLKTTATGFSANNLNSLLPPIRNIIVKETTRMQRFFASNGAVYLLLIMEKVPKELLEYLASDQLMRLSFKHYTYPAIFDLSLGDLHTLFSTRNKQELRLIRNNRLQVMRNINEIMASLFAVK